ncbi:hypothetical protein J23TS9_45330 [Paenibacillus sp. J23TS9]|uniref:hypothetical protein n=1 Tax=Paenibacillus sp. J23TS9 TaxID=2807193 RepID=UPI001B1F824C|nr:hypothetical protein [Paenibacillus sp. J23TS9]GIP29403.1 hypothetical protein J23TS9_45330 [Paenibacillus sp. J23TS9]
MKVIFLIMAVIIILSGCNAGKVETLPLSKPSFMYSNVEGKYYVAAFGTTAKQFLEFQQVFDQNIEKITGYYETGTPSDEELQMFNIKDLPEYIVFDTEKELFRTDNLDKLNQFLMKKHN